jgi:hypothetical protein
VTLEADALTVRCFRARRQLRCEISGTFGRGAILLGLKGSRGGHLSLAVPLREDAAFRAWFESLPKYDPAAEQEAAAVQSAALGVTHAEMLTRFKRARAVNGAFWLAALAACIWGIYPRPYETAMIALVALPWILFAIERFSPLRHAYGAGKLGPSMVPYAFGLSGVGLVIPTPLPLSGIHVQGWEAAVAIGILAGGALALALVAREPRARTRLLLPVVLAGACLYAHGAAFTANAFFDRSRPEVFTADVVGKRVSRGRPRTKWIVRLGPSEWGDPMNELLVPPHLYESIEPGGTVCVLLRPGALGIAWFTLEACGR